MQEQAQVTSLLAAIDPAALPIVVVVIALGYLYFKFKRVEEDRLNTKQIRDEDSQKLHDEVLGLKFKVTALEGIAELHRGKLDSIDQQLSIVNTELAKLNLQVESLVKALEQQNRIMLKQLGDK